MTKEEKRVYDIEYCSKNREKINLKHKIKHQKYYPLRGKYVVIKRKYGLEKEDYMTMVANQKICPICKELFTEKNPPVIDHCHTSGKVRALLHDKCNRELGRFEKNWVLIPNMIKYLEDHETELVNTLNERTS